ncbi:hypothetical protein B0H17DRAFT_1183247 [Mycena rosella]|uniref:Uncharacterized protein n=1 Tax=Mycena rosella TaxID=1033263 RepID=A0AAD7GAU0_MYCRO|nr:hypothetical protein B0H17DRAFT_1183247 [Mycena rosella]
MSVCCCVLGSTLRATAQWCWSFVKPRWTSQGHNYAHSDKIEDEESAIHAEWPELQQIGYRSSDLRLARLSMARTVPARGPTRRPPGQILCTHDQEPVALFPFNANDGAYAAFSTQWKRAFQSKSKLDPIELKFHLVCRGKNGLVLAHTWAAHYVGFVGLTYARDLDMIPSRLEALLALIRLALKAHEDNSKRKHRKEEKTPTEPY